MEKRTLIAIAVSFLILGFYPFVLERFYPGYNKVQKTAPSPLPAEAGRSLTPAEAISVSPSSRAGRFLSEDDVTFQDNKLKLLFNKEGGSIREISFLDFKDSATGDPIKLISLEKTMGAPALIQFLEYSPDPGEALSYVMRMDSPDEVTATHTGRELKITKKYLFKRGGYGADVTVTFENLSDRPLDFRYQMFAGSGITPRRSVDPQFIEANFFSGAEGKNNLRHIKETKLGKTVQSHGAVDWVATKDRHFSIVLKPAPGFSYTGLVQGLGNEDSSVSLVSEKVILPPRGSAEHRFLLYMGPNEINELLPFGLDPIVNFGKLDAIGKILVGGLELLQKIFRNYGIAIIILTFLINVLLFPLTRQSYMSMKRMQLVQPHMTKLKEQHKKNPEKLNKEMMELYKKHKVNPFGGCLPMVLQMPVFMALYVALSKSGVLVNAQFLWVKDLSSPDSIPLPFSLPFIGNEFHLLPLIMTGAMIFQQKFTQVKMEGQDPTMEMQQKMMTVMMPVVFLFIFYTMPSGLVLYWLTNTVLMTLYQLRLKKMTLA